MKIVTQSTVKNEFAGYGEVIKSPEGNPTSQDLTYKFWSNLGNYFIDGQTEIGICTVYKQKANIISGVERHLKTPEILIPIDSPFVLPLLKEGDGEKNMVAFRVEVGEAVVIYEGVWHGACLPINTEAASYFVIFRLNTPHEDVIKKDISPIMIEVQSQ